jgi:GNAT superfamily N-acetyltransferase
VTDAISICPAAASDLGAVTELAGAVHWPHRPADIQLAMELGHAAIARIDGTDDLAGIAVWWAYGAGAARIGLVIVSPEHQGRGIGRRLMEQLFEDAGPRSFMLLTTEIGRPLYQRLGFRVVGETQRHQGVYAKPPTADPRIRAAARADHAAMLELDAGAMGADRAQLLKRLFESGRTLVISHEGRVTGYAVEHTFGLGAVVGPIVAASERDAVALFRAIAPPGFVRVDRPMSADLLGRHLTECGLTGDVASDVMLLGDWPPTSGPARIFAMAGHAWG